MRITVNDWNEIQAEDTDTKDKIILGDADELEADYQHAVARNNESRSFDEWLISKAENQMY